MKFRFANKSWNLFTIFAHILSIKESVKCFLGLTVYFYMLSGQWMISVYILWLNREHTELFNKQLCLNIQLVYNKMYIHEACCYINFVSVSALVLVCKIFYGFLLRNKETQSFISLWTIVSRTVSHINKVMSGTVTGICREGWWFGKGD